MRILIVTRGRAGSGSLCSALQAHEDLKGIQEPFNPVYHDGKFAAASPEQVAEHFETLWGDYQLIKHCWGHADWPFMGTRMMDCTMAVLDSPDTIYILLNRRNVLQRLVSSHIAQASRVWNLRSVGDREKILRGDFPEINISQVHHVLQTELPTIAAMVAKLQRLKTPFIQLWYEDFFDPALTLKARCAKYELLLSMLGLPKDRYDSDRVTHFLSAEQRKIASEELYLRVPGAEEINKLFGCDSTGYLFPPRSV